MKLRKHFIFAAMLLGLSLSACNQSNPKITGYLIDENNNVVVIYDNGSQETVGNLTDEDIVNHVTSITISQDGYFVINGIKTSTKVNFNSVTISQDGYYVIDGIKTSIKAGFDSITISSDGYYVVNGVKTSIKVQFDSVEISDDGYYVINGIKTDIKATNVYTVKFNTGYSATVADQKVFEGHKVERPQLNRTGYNLNGWFCNGEEWRFNSDVVLNDMTLDAEWTAKQYTVSFVNEKGTNPTDMTVTYDADYILPTVDSVEGYTFGGWYNGSTKYSGGKWTTDSNVTLTAKWTANTYTVTLNPGVGSVSTTSKQVTYGQNYTLPVPTNSYGVFAGWLCDGEAVTDSSGHSLAPWTYLENKTFTVDWVIKIYNKTDLLKLGTYLNAEFEIMNDINVAGTDWTPIGTKAAPFTGGLEGNGHSIIGLTIASCNGYSGLFGCVNGASIQNVNLSLAGITIPTANKDSYVGSICGYAESTAFCNVTVSGVVSTANHSSDYVGMTAGVCAYAKTSSFVNVSNLSTVEGYYTVGGVVAYSENSTFSTCFNTGNVTSTYETAGGIIAKVDTSDVNGGTYNYSKLVNRGNITSAFYTGGIIGKITDNSLTTFAFSECCNYGSVRSTNNEGTSNAAGGIMGNAYNMKFVNCYNRGNVSAYNAGGLAGYTNLSGEFKNCYSSGNISGTMYVGGMGGWINQSTTKESITFGTISSTHDFSVNTCGTDKINTPTVSNVYYNCSAKNYVGTSTSETYSGVFYTGTLFWNSDVWSFHIDAYPTFAWEL